MALNSRGLSGFRRRLSRGVWLVPGLCRGFFRFGRWFSDRLGFQVGLFRYPMMAMVQRLHACGFFFYPQLSVAIFLAFVLEVFRNRFRCHGESVAEPATPCCPLLVTRRQFMSRQEGAAGPPNSRTCGLRIFLSYSYLYFTTSNTVVEVWSDPLVPVRPSRCNFRLAKACASPLRAASGKSYPAER
jgi:hypothetical protein